VQLGCVRENHGDLQYSWSVQYSVARAANYNQLYSVGKACGKSSIGADMPNYWELMEIQYMESSHFGTAHVTNFCGAMSTLASTAPDEMECIV